MSGVYYASSKKRLRNPHLPGEPFAVTRRDEAVIRADLAKQLAAILKRQQERWKCR